jgi:uncharacterized protein YndB with AHSA1/START domain
VWAAITNPEFSRQYWVDGIVSDWKKGSKWQHLANTEGCSNGLGGEVLESVPPKRLVITWGDATPASGPSRVAFDIEAIEDMVRLVVTHNNLEAGSVMAGKISTGWPRVLCSMKSMLETGKALDTWAGQPAVAAAAA